MKASTTREIKKVNSQLRQMISRLGKQKQLLGVLVVAAFAFSGVNYIKGSQAAPSGGDSGGPLLVSQSADKRPAVGGRVVVNAGTPLYVFLQQGNVSRVAFTVTDASGVAVASRTDTTSPYDLLDTVSVVNATEVSTPQPWTPAEGAYTVAAKVTSRDGRERQYSLPVTVRPAYGTPGSN